MDSHLLWGLTKRLTPANMLTLVVFEPTEGSERLPLIAALSIRGRLPLAGYSPVIRYATGLTAFPT